MRGARVVPLVAVLIALAGCPGPSAHPADPHPPAPVDAAAPPPIDAAIAEAPAPVTEAECVQFVEHTLEIGMAQQRATKPSDYVPTDDQVGAIRAKLIASKPCSGLTRPQWECAQGATTQDALYRCAQ